MGTYWRRLLTAVCWLLWPSWAAAESPTNLSWDAELRFRGERTLGLNEAEPLLASKHHGWFQRSRLGARLERDALTAVIQLQSSSVLGAAGPGSDPLPLGLQQGWLRARLPWGADTWVEAGRMSLEYGAARQIGRYDFDAVGQAFDGARLHFGLERRLQADAFVAQLRRTAGQPDRQRMLGGVHLSATPHDSVLTELYVLYLHDDEPAQDTHLLTMGTRVKTTPIPQFAFEAEGAVQTGQQRQRAAILASDHLAWMAATTAVARLRTAVLVEGGLFGHLFSGDGDPSDSVRRTWRPLYPSRDQVVGLMQQFTTSNLAEAGLRLSVDLQPLQLPVLFETQVRRSHAIAADVLPGLSGGTLSADPHWQTLGWGGDARLRWQAWRQSELMLALAWFSGSETIRQARGLDTGLSGWLQWMTQL